LSRRAGSPTAGACGNAAGRGPRAPRPAARPSRLVDDMNETHPRSFARTVVAALILLVGAWVLLHFIIGIASFVLSTLVFVLAVVAVLWALRVLL